MSTFCNLEKLEMIWYVQWILFLLDKYSLTCLKGICVGRCRSLSTLQYIAYHSGSKSVTLSMNCNIENELLCFCDLKVSLWCKDSFNAWCWQRYLSRINILLMIDSLDFKLILFHIAYRHFVAFTQIYTVLQRKVYFYWFMTEHFQACDLAHTFRNY